MVVVMAIVAAISRYDHHRPISAIIAVVMVVVMMVIVLSKLDVFVG